LKTLEVKIIQVWAWSNLTEMRKYNKLWYFETEIFLKRRLQAGLNGLMTWVSCFQDAEDRGELIAWASDDWWACACLASSNLDVKTSFWRRKRNIILNSRCSGCFENQRNLHRNLKINFDYVRQHLVGFRCIYHWEWKEISVMHGSKISDEPIGSRLGHASFILKHPEFLVTQDDPEELIGIYLWTKKTMKCNLICFVLWKLFLIANFLHVGWWWGSIPQAGSWENLGLNSNLIGSIGQWRRSSRQKRFWSYLLDDHDH